MVLNIKTGFSCLPNNNTRIYSTYKSHVPACLESLDMIISNYISDFILSNIVICPRYYEDKMTQISEHV